MNRFSRFLLAFIALLGITLAVHAADVTTVYHPARHGTVRQATFAADAIALETTSGPIATGGAVTLSLSATLSAAGATTKLLLVRGDWDGQVWRPVDTIATGTIAASSSYTLGGRYPTDAINFDTGGLSGFQVVIQTTSAGTCEVNYVLR